VLADVIDTHIVLFLSYKSSADAASNTCHLIPKPPALNPEP